MGQLIPPAPLSRDHRYQGAGIGQGLLRDALARTMNVSEQIGARALIVHALNEILSQAWFFNRPDRPWNIVVVFEVLG